MRQRVTRFLLAQGADVNAADKTGATPLHTAARLGRTRVVELLLAGGANPKARDGDGRTPGDLARGNQHEKAADLLAETPRTTDGSAASK